MTEHKAHEWHRIEQHYAALAPAYSSMRELTRSIVDSGLSSALYAVTSHAGLMLFQTPTFSFASSQNLEIDFIPKTGEIEFRFQKYRKRCPSSEGFETLMFVLSNRLGWVQSIPVS